MATLRWAIACFRIIIDRATNSVSYIDTVEAWSVPSLDSPLGPFNLGTVWERETVGESIIHRIRVTNPAGEEVASLARELVHAEAIRHRSNMSLHIDQVKMVGRFLLHVEQQVGGEWRTEVSIPLVVTLEEEAERE